MSSEARVCCCTLLTRSETSLASRKAATRSWMRAQSWWKGSGVSETRGSGKAADVVIARAVRASTSAGRGACAAVLVSTSGRNGGLLQGMVPGACGPLPSRAGWHGRGSLRRLHVGTSVVPHGARCGSRRRRPLRMRTVSRCQNHHHCALRCNQSSPLQRKPAPSPRPPSSRAW